MEMTVVIIAVFKYLSALLIPVDWNSVDNDVCLVKAWAAEMVRRLEQWNQSNCCIYIGRSHLLAVKSIIVVYLRMYFKKSFSYWIQVVSYRKPVYCEKYQ